MVLLMGMLKASMAALAGLIAILTVPTTLHIPLRDAAVHGATRLRVYLGMANMNRVRRRPTDSVIVPPVPQGDPAVQEEVMDLQVSTSLDTAESTEPPTEPEACTSSDGSESIEAAVGPRVSMSQEGADVLAPSTHSTSNIVLPAGSAEGVQLVAEVRYWFSVEQQRDTCPGLYSALRPSPSRSRPVYPIVPPPGALIVRNDPNDQARPPIDLWVIVAVAIPSVFIISMVLRRCARNNSRRRFPALELSVSSEVAGDSSNEVDTGDVDDNIDTTFEHPTERIEAIPNSHDVAFPSPIPRFAPVMERTPNMDGSSESEAGSGSLPSTSFVAIAPPIPEPSINSESEASAADFQDAHPQVPANVPDNTGRTTESIEDLCVSHSRLPTSSMDMLPGRAVSGYNGVRYLYVPHFQFTVYLDGMAQAAPTADTSNNLLDFSAPLASLSNARGSIPPLSISPPSDHPVTSNAGASPSYSGLITPADPDTSYPANADAEPTSPVPTAHASPPLIIITEASESLHASPATCNDVIHAQDAVLVANTSQSGDMATPDRGGSTEASAVLLPDGPSAIMTGTSGVSTVIGVDIPFPSGVETQAEGALHPMMTGAGIDDLNEGLAVPTVAGPSLVVASDGRTEDLEAYSDHHREQSVASMGTHHPEDNDRPARATKQARKGPRRVREWARQPSPLGLYSYVPCSQALDATSAPVDMVEPQPGGATHSKRTQSTDVNATELLSANDRPLSSSSSGSGILMTSQSPSSELQESTRVEERGTQTLAPTTEEVAVRVHDDCGTQPAEYFSGWALPALREGRDPTDINNTTIADKRSG